MTITEAARRATDVGVGKAINDATDRATDREADT